MKETIIPKGYRLTVVSWENDADNYNTKAMEGLSKEETRFLVDLISLLKSRYGQREKRSFGNLYEPSDADLDAFQVAVEDVITKHDVTKFSFGKYFLPPSAEELEEGVERYYVLNGATDFLSELGLTGSGKFYSRVLDNYKVEYVPQDVKWQDVTNQFKTT